MEPEGTSSDFSLLEGQEKPENQCLSKANCSVRSTIKLANAASSTLRSVGSPLTNASISTFCTVFSGPTKFCTPPVWTVSIGHTEGTHKSRGRTVEQRQDRRSRTGKHRRDSSRSAHWSLSFVTRSDEAQLFRSLVGSQHGRGFLQRVGKLQRQVLDPHWEGTFTPATRTQSVTHCLVSVTLRPTTEGKKGNKEKKVEKWRQREKKG